MADWTTYGDVMIRYMLLFLLGLLSFNANAQLAVTANGNLTFDMGPAPAYGFEFDVTHTEPGTFTDIIEFRLSKGKEAMGDLAVYRGVTPVSFDLYNSQGLVYQSFNRYDWESGETSFLLNGYLDAGSYYFKIVGQAGGVTDPLVAGTYQFINAVTPVPEPSTYALMLMGLLGLGYSAARRARGTVRSGMAGQDSLMGA
jgi:PEP-CTERM motif